MKRKYDPELIKDDLKKLTQQTLKEALEAEFEEFETYPKNCVNIIPPPQL